MKMIMTIITCALIMALTASLVAGFRVTTSSYEVDKTTTGLAGGEADTSNYAGRMLWEPWQPASEALTSFYWLSPGYWETFFLSPTYDIAISLVQPPNGFYTNAANVSFEHFTSTNGSISACNLLVYYNTSLTINNTVTSPGVGAYNWSSYALPEDDYTWNVLCNNSAGNWSSSSTFSFTVDRTPPAVTINGPDDGDTKPSPVSFEFDIDELNPDYLLINVNGTVYNYTFNDGANIFNLSIPEGVYSWNVTAYDLAGNSASYGPFTLYVNNDSVSINSVSFSPNPPKTLIDNTLSAVIDGSFSTVVVSVDIDGAGWTNYTVVTFSGTGPYTYSQVIDNALFGVGDVLSQQWFVLDNLAIWQESDVYNATVQQKTSSGGSFPDVDIGGPVGNLIIIPETIYVRTLKGSLFSVYNNGTAECTLKSVTVEEKIGSEDLQDRIKVKTLSLQDGFEVQQNKSLGLLLKPTGLQGLAGNGLVVVESENCGSVTADLAVEVHFTEIIIDGLNNFTSNVINWFKNLMEAI